MKFILGLTVVAVGASFLIANKLDASNLTANKVAIAPDSVAFHCAKAIPQIFSKAKEAGDDFGGIPESVAFAGFDYVTTNYCLCNQEKFGNDHSAAEKELFGQLAGLNLKLSFSNTIGKKYREELKQEGQTIFKKNSGLFKLQPAWLKQTNDIFRTCKEEQKIRGNLISQILK